MSVKEMAVTEPASMWEMKPWWCQPWSIVLTGVTIPVASWLLLHTWWITLPIVGAIAVWWLLFLVLVPAQYADYMAQAREGDPNL
ncbi:MAG: DUF6737 family protein [Phormidesmis sp.]